MTDAQYDRQKCIEELVNDDLVNNEHGDFLKHLLIVGFKGYVSFTDEEIMAELEDRDISYLFGDDDYEYDGQPDEAQEWHDFDPDA